MSYRNAKQEFLDEINDTKEEVVCAKIGVDKEKYGTNITWFSLKPGFTKEEFNAFCDSLDFEYDDGYGTQELYGMILFKDSYSERHEYDGSEHWTNNKMPTVEEVMRLK